MCREYRGGFTKLYPTGAKYKKHLNSNCKNHLSSKTGNTFNLLGKYISNYLSVSYCRLRSSLTYLYSGSTPRTYWHSQGRDYYSPLFNFGRDALLSFLQYTKIGPHEFGLGIFIETILPAIFHVKTNVLIKYKLIRFWINLFMFFGGNFNIVIYNLEYELCFLHNTIVSKK